MKSKTAMVTMIAATLASRSSEKEIHKIYDLEPWPFPGINYKMVTQRKHKANKKKKRLRKITQRSRRINHPR